MELESVTSMEVILNNAHGVYVGTLCIGGYQFEYVLHLKTSLDEALASSSKQSCCDLVVLEGTKSVELQCDAESTIIGVLLDILTIKRSSHLNRVDRSGHRTWKSQRGYRAEVPKSYELENALRGAAHAI